MDQQNQNNPNFTQIPMYPEYAYDDAEELDRDVDYMKEMYPKAVRAIQKEIDEECDKLEYEGSCMFDEYPNSEHLGTIVDAIYERIMDSNPDGFSVQAEQLMPPEQLPPWGPLPYRPVVGPGPVRPMQMMRPPRPPQPPRPPFPPQPPQPPRPPRPPKPSRPDYGSDGSPDWMKNLISVLLYNEMLHRRRRYRRRRRPYRSFN